jgi:hypothetical protein
VADGVRQCRAANLPLAYESFRQRAGRAEAAVGVGAARAGRFYSEEDAHAEFAACKKFDVTLLAPGEAGLAALAGDARGRAGFCSACAARRTP